MSSQRETNFLGNFPSRSTYLNFVLLLFVSKVEHREVKKLCWPRKVTINRNSLTFDPMQSSFSCYITSHGYKLFTPSDGPYHRLYYCFKCLLYRSSHLKLKRWLLKLHLKILHVPHPRVNRSTNQTRTILQLLVILVKMRNQLFLLQIL